MQKESAVGEQLGEVKFGSEAASVVKQAKRGISLQQAMENFVRE
jgi:hypothetical protein